MPLTVKLAVPRADRTQRVSCHNQLTNLSVVVDNRTRIVVFSNCSPFDEPSDGRSG